MKVYSINLKKRTDRKKHSFAQFDDKKEFEMSLFPAIEHQIGAVGLWKTLTKIVEYEQNSGEEDFFIFCEDDHTFTEIYSQINLIKAITASKLYDADILLGGVSWFDRAVQVTENIFWLNDFTGAQFVVIFKKFYQKILDQPFGVHDSLDRIMSRISDNMFVMYPFISIQQEFGYSDVTVDNNRVGRVENLFSRTSQILALLSKVKNHYMLKV